MASSPIAVPASPTAVTSARMRVGVVQASPAPQADFVWVSVDGSTVQATYFTGYVPIAGDRVVLTQDGTDWFVLGGKSGYAGNLVVNGVFDSHPSPAPSTFLPAYMWDRFQASGAPTILIVGFNASSQMNALVWLTSPPSSSASDSYAYSAAFPVTPGETLYADLVGRVAGSSGILATATVRLAWFGDGQSTYPNQSSETVLDTQTSTGVATDWLTSTTTTVPASAAYARLALRLQYAGGGGSGATATIYRAEVHR